MGTIVQKYGPIYGEAVNGTVQGRPNGSYYVPSTNTIGITLEPDHRYITLTDNFGPTRLAFCTDDGTVDLGGPCFMKARCQDLSCYMELQIFSDAECTTMIASRDHAAGDFNDYYHAILEDPELTDGQDLYVRAQLMSSTGIPIATSTVIPIVAVIPE